MYHSNEATLSLADGHVCPSCGSLTKAKPTVKAEKKQGTGFVILGWVTFLLSLVFVPILFGAISLCMGFWTYHERSKAHGVIMMFFAAVGTVIGSLISIFVAGTPFI